MERVETEQIPEFDISKISDEPTEKAVAIMEMLDENMFIIEKYKGFEYEDFIETLLHSMLEGFEHKEFRDHPVMYKFKDDPNEKVKWLPFRHFIINTMF